MNTAVTQKKNIIIFDIDSGSIAAGLFEYGYDKKNQLVQVRALYQIRKNITDGTHYSFDEFWVRTKKTLDTVAREVHLQSLVPLDGVYCNVSSPWVSAQRRVINYSRSKPFVFTQELADSLIAKEIDSPLAQNIDYANHSVELIDRHTVDVFGNGYSLRRPLGQEMTELNLHTLISVMSIDTKLKFTEIIERHFHREAVFLSNTFVAYNEVQENLPDTNSSIVLDISGEVTDILDIKKDHLDHVGVIPVGIHSVVRDFANKKGIALVKAYKLLELFSRGKIDPDYEKEIRISLSESFLLWLKPFYSAIDEIARHGLLSNVLVIKMDQRHRAWFEELLLSREELSQHMHARPIQIQHILDEGRPHRLGFSILDSKDIELNILADYLGIHSLLNY